MRNWARWAAVCSAAIAIGPGAVRGAPVAVQPVTVQLWDVPRTNQIRGAATFQPLGLGPGFTVQVSLTAAGPGPDTALIGTGSCTKYKKLYQLKPAVNGLSNTTLARAKLLPLFQTPHVIVLPKLEYCGALKSIFLR